MTAAHTFDIDAVHTQKTAVLEDPECDYAFIRDMLREVNYDAWFSFEHEGGFDSKWDQSIRTLVDILKS